MKIKKKSEISIIGFIIFAVICLVVLVLVGYLIMKMTGETDKELNECEVHGGYCLHECLPGELKLKSKCHEKETQCCLIFEEQEVRFVKVNE